MSFSTASPSANPRYFRAPNDSPSRLFENETTPRSENAPIAAPHSDRAARESFRNLPNDTGAVTADTLGKLADNPRLPLTRQTTTAQEATVS